MIKPLLKYLLLLICVSPAVGQTVIQGDSTFLQLYPYKSTIRQVHNQLGHRYKAEDIMGSYTAKVRGGGCISGKYIAVVKMNYRKMGVTCYVGKNERNKNSFDKLSGIDFDSTANIQSAKGIQPGKHTFADVIERYGPIDFDK